ncbi:hypothetical protein CapIbe_000301 [Capra ibex]
MLAQKRTLGFPSGLCRKGFFQTSLDSEGCCISETITFGKQCDEKELNFEMPAGMDLDVSRSHCVSEPSWAHSAPVTPYKLLLHRTALSKPEQSVWTSPEGSHHQKLILKDSTLCMLICTPACPDPSPLWPSAFVYP